jgi:putative acetyltransferase
VTSVEETIEIAVDDTSAADVRALLERHLAFAHEVTPSDHVHALDVDALMDAAVTFVTARRAGRLVGVGAIRELDTLHGELKSMHTAEPARRQGVGRAVLAHLVGVARARGYRRVYLETGTGAAFASAQVLYSSAGFEPCEPFAEYTRNPYSVCMSMEL